jgi:taurine dioxygenase
MTLEIVPFERGFGAEVRGIAPDLDIPDAQFRQVSDAWTRHSVLRFRGLRMSPEQHIAFSRRLGPLHIMKPLKFNLEGHPEVFVVSNASKDDPSRPVTRSEAGEAGLRRAGEGFHTDGEDKRIPNAGSLLYALRVPPERGDTLFVDMYAAYEALPEAVRQAIAGRRARYSRIDLHGVHYPHMGPLTEEEKRDRPDVFHPLARRHPVSGRTSLYIGRWACDVEGLAPEEGRRLIAYLQDFAQQPRFQFRQQWQQGDAVLWDNRCTQHCATGFDDAAYVRTMYRTTLEGDEPVMARTTAGISLP